ncbi:MAG TPA: DNA primase [Bacillota bacterium]|nr:DNA primase [Bacillota bacterium]HOG52985.1 DNA primase [Bacillota bacterium]
MAGAVPDEIIEKIRQQTDIVGLISEYITLKQNGSRFVGLCPFHNEKTPSFSVSKDKQLYYCFGCHASGNVFSFVMNMDGMTFIEAVRRLGSRIGIDISEHLESEDERARRQFRERIMEACETAARYYSWMLTESKNGLRCREYAKGRGIDDAVQRAFRIGYAPSTQSMDGLSSYLAKKGFDENVLIEAGLSLKKKFGVGLMDVFRDRMILPIANQYGKVVAFGGRVIETGDKRPKYINSKEGPAYSKRNNLYNIHAASTHARSAGRMVLCEGYLDAIAFWRSGIKEVVASLGTALTPEQAKLIARHCSRVILSYDSDKAGSAATVKAVDILQEAGLEVSVAVLPDGEDPDSLLRKQGEDSLRKAVDDSVSFLRYQIERTMAESDVSREDGKLSAVRRLVRIIAGCPDAVTRAELVREISGRLAVSPDALNQDVSKAYARSPKTKQGRNGSDSKDQQDGASRMEFGGFSYSIAETEKAILRLIAKDPKSIKLVSDKLTEGFETEGIEELYRAMVTLWEDGKAIDERVLGMIDAKNRDAAAKLLMETESTFKDVGMAIEALKSIKARRRLRDINASIQRAELENRLEDIERLQTEQKALRQILGNRTALY